MLFRGDRDEVNGVHLVRACIIKVTAVDKNSDRLDTIHLVGDVKGAGFAQVCSPIRKFELMGDGVIAITRSHNKYIVMRNDINQQMSSNASYLITTWLGETLELKEFMKLEDAMKSEFLLGDIDD